MENKTNECHKNALLVAMVMILLTNRVGVFTTRHKTPAKIFPLKGRKFSFIGKMTTKLCLHIIEETCIA